MTELLRIGIKVGFAIEIKNDYFTAQLGSLQENGNP
jgi:hypothetical protein